MPEHSNTSHSHSPAPQPGASLVTATDLVLRQARKLHRAAKSGTISSAMPAVRRVHAAGIFPGRPLSALYRGRQELKRKHFLRALAVEAGFPDWESFRPALDHLPVEDFAHFKVADEWGVFLNSWFSNEREAQAFVAERGGRVVRVGAHAVVLSSEAPVERACGDEHAA